MLLPNFGKGTAKHGVHKEIMDYLVKKVDFAEPIPKYYQLKTGLKSWIKEKGLKTGESIPSSYLLSERFGITRVTANKVLDELEKEGIVYRSQGRGTFVKKQEAGVSSGQMAGLMMATHGHLWGQLSHNIIARLRDYGYFCVAADVPLYDKPPSEGCIRHLKRLVSMKPAGLIIWGSSRFPFQILDGFSGRVVFIVEFEGKSSPRADYVLSDYLEGGKMVANHFLSLGYEEIVFYTHPVLPHHKSQLQVISGLRSSLEKNGLPDKNLIIIEENRTALARTIEKRKKPVAVLCDGDHMARPVYDIAKRLNLKIPSRISVVGYYNTPWTEVMDPHLTSISIQEEKITETAVRKIAGENRPEKVLIAPSLVIRDSCGGRK